MIIGESMCNLLNRTGDFDFKNRIRNIVDQRTHWKVGSKVRLNVLRPQDRIVGISQASRVYFLTELKKVGQTQSELIWR